MSLEGVWLQVAICEDELIHQQNLFRIIDEWRTSKNIKIDIDTFVTSEEFLYQYDRGKGYDIVFFDIHLKGMDGVKAARKLRERDESIIIIFLTSRMEYVLQGYEVNAWRYLLKPVHSGDVTACLNKAYDVLEKVCEYFLVKFENKLYKVPYNSILYMESFGHYISIYTKEKVYEIRMSLSQLESRLPKEFYRCHRSYIINTTYCKAMEEQQVLVNDKWIAFSEKKRKELMVLLEE